MKRPTPGTKIVHRCPYQGTHEGTVESSLSAQFTYRDEQGDLRWCLLNEDWKEVK